MDDLQISAGIFTFTTEILNGKLISYAVILSLSKINKTEVQLFKCFIHRNYWLLCKICHITGVSGTPRKDASAKIFALTYFTQWVMTSIMRYPEKIKSQILLMSCYSFRANFPNDVLAFKHRKTFISFLDINLAHFLHLIILYCSLVSA